MDCYKFELNITSFLDGELKQSIRSEFLQHKKNCSNCNEQLSGVEEMINSLSGLKQVTTSEDFFRNLQHEIDNYENRGIPFIKKLQNIKLFGLQLELCN